MPNCCDPCEPQSKDLSLEEWRLQMCCIPPYYFWQWEGENCAHKGACKHTVTELNWQTPSDMAREDVRGAISEAQELLRDYLDYPVVPTWITEEIAINRGCEWDPIRLQYNHVRAVGQEVETLLGTADVTVTVPANNNCPDTFTLTYTLTPQQVIDNPDLVAEEICVRVPDEYAPAPHQAPNWDSEIRPIYATVVGDTITIEGSAWLAGRPIPRISPGMPGQPFSLFQNSNTFDPLWLGGEFPGPEDPSFESNYLPELDIYRKTIDPCIGGSMRYDTPICHCGNRACDDDENTNIDDHCGCCIDMAYCITNGRLGVVRPAPQDCCNPGCNCRCSRPTHHCVRYMAVDCSRDWKPAISKLAAALLCKACRCPMQCLEDLQIDLSREDVRENGRRVSFAEMDAIWGTRAGAVQAWKIARPRRELRLARI